MELKIKLLSDKAIIPTYALKGDAGLDLTATNSYEDENENICYETGIAVEIPEGYVGLLFPRSSCSERKLVMSNSVGAIDSNYRGEIIVKFKDLGASKLTYYSIGERIAQLIIIPIPKIEFKVVSELSESNRGNKGYGSTGK